MRIGIYCRVSTQDQEVENQLVKLREYAQLRGWEVAGEFLDHAASGKKANRPALNKLKEDIKKRKIEGVLVWKLDRLGRSLVDLVYLLDFFRIHNCTFISYSNNVDTSTPEGKLMFHIIASFAEFEHALISERTKLAYDRKKVHAEALGQKVRWGRKKKVEKIDEICKLRSEGWSYGRIAKELGISKSQVYRRVNEAFQNGG